MSVSFAMRCLVVGVVGLLTACNKPPSVDAGNDKIYYERATVVIKAKVTDENEDDTHTFRWKQTGGPETDGLDGVDSDELVIYLPSISEDEEYTFSVKVTDSGGESARDDVVIRAKAYTKLEDLDFADPNLQQCANTQLLHLAFRDMGEATELVCNGMQISSLDGLDQLPNLETLTIRNNQVDDLGAVRILRKLQSLDISGNPVKELAPIAQLRELRELRTMGTRVRDVSPLAKLRNLEWLNAGSLSLDNSALTTIAKLDKLTVLKLNHTGISDARPLAALGELEELHLNSNRLGPIAGLEKLEYLESLILDDNPAIRCAELKTVVDALGEDVVSAPASCVR